MAINLAQPYIQTITLAGKDIDILRLDAIHPIVSGNKWYKLKAYIEYIQENGLKGFVTFGGAYSNHLHAAAMAGRLYGIERIGIVRGAEHEHHLNETLIACREQGMQLEFISRKSYGLKEDPDFLASLQQRFPSHIIIPEGGSGNLGVQGVADICAYIDTSYTHILLSVGSGTTLQGIRNNTPQHQKIIGFAPMKKGHYLNEVLICNKNNWYITDQFHFGGFGRHNDTLIRFMNETYTTHGVPTDKVYTAKMLYGLEQMIHEGAFAEDTKIIVIHTGGLQGNHSIKQKITY